MHSKYYKVLFWNVQVTSFITHLHIVFFKDQTKSHLQYYTQPKEVLFGLIVNFTS